MDNAYSGYSYRRYKRRRRIYPYFAAFFAAGTIFLAANLVFCFIDFSAIGAEAKLPAVTFYTTENGPFVNKSDALEQSLNIKEQGGSGYLLSNDDGWNVVGQIGLEKFENGAEYITKEKTIKLTNRAHKSSVEFLLSTFKTTFETLCGYITGYENGVISQHEISNSSRSAYNNLVELSSEFEKIQQKNDSYAQISIYLTRQLLGLNMIWVEGGGEDFLHTLKNAASWIIFAYFDLTEAL